VHEYYIQQNKEKVDFGLLQFRPNRPDCPTAFLSKFPSFIVLLYEIALAISLKYDEELIIKEEFLHRLSGVGIGYPTLLCDLQSAGYNPYAEIGAWVDAEMAYVCKDSFSFVEMAILADFYDLHQMVNVTIVQLVQLWAMVHTTINDTAPRMRRAMEHLLRPYVHQNIPSISAVYTISDLHIKDFKLFLGSVVATEDLLNGHFLKLKPDNGCSGLDSVVFYFERFGKRCDCIVHGWQNKSGYYAHKIAAGYVPPELLRRAYKEKRVPYICDAHLHAIIVEAEIALGLLIDALLTTLPYISTVTVKTLLLTTSREGRRAGEFLRRDMQSAFRMNPNLLRWRHRHKLRPVGSEIVFFHGLDWILTCLPEDLARFLPPAWHQRVTAEANARSADSTKLVTALEAKPQRSNSWMECGCAVM
jgi:hypothetical protein